MSFILERGFKMINYTPTRQTQDWQLEAYEIRGKHNSVVRHQRTIEEMERNVSTWGRNMSRPNTK
jgi:hypothetical protein